MKVATLAFEQVAYIATQALQSRQYSDAYR